MQMPTPLCAANYPAVFREGDDSRIAPTRTHIHTHVHTERERERAREGDIEGVVRRTAVAAGCGGGAEGCVICEPESATLPPTPRRPVVGPLSRIVTRRAAGSGILAAPELLTLSVTHFHFIICPLHPRIAPSDDA